MFDELKKTIFWITTLLVFGLSIGGIAPVADWIGATFGFLSRGGLANSGLNRNSL